MNQTDLLKRTKEDGDCLIWTGSLIHHNAPVFSLAGKKIYVKRHLMELAGKKVDGFCVISTCKCQLCVNPEHLKIVKRKDVLKATVASGVLHTPSIRAKITKAKRETSKLSQDSVRELMASTEHVPTMAKRMGITEAYAYMIRRGRFRREISSPWAGLGA